MFGIGFGEVLVIAVILIIVVGPARLPGLMASLGRTLRSARQASDELRSSLGLRELMRQDRFDPYEGSRPTDQRKQPPVGAETDPGVETEGTKERTKAETDAGGAVDTGSASAAEPGGTADGAAGKSPQPGEEKG
jgi:sec-independent protein translocase protein TatB